MITVEELSVLYRQENKENLALKGLSLEVGQGEICAMIGPSGCGKSTLLQVLAGLIPPYQGRVTVKGVAPDPKNSRIGFVPQQYGLLPWATVYENAVLGLKVKGDSLTEEQGEITAILEDLGLTALAKKYPSRLSGGEQQRVAIARAFLLKPDVLLMDEPFSALDAINREKMQSLFLDIWQKQKVTTVFVTHSVEEAIVLGQKIAILTPSPGRVADVVENPLFGAADLQMSEAFYAFGLKLRKMAGEIWN